MKINNIASSDYRVIGNILELDLICTANEALAMDVAIIEVRTDDGDLVESFVGYAKKSVVVDAITGKTTLKLLCGADGALIESVAALRNRLDEFEQKESIETRQSDAAIQTLALFAAPNLTDVQVASIPWVWAEWDIDVEYKAKTVVSYKGYLYRVAQKHTSQEQWKPGDGTESLYTKINIAPDGIDIWQRPTGGHDTYAKGKKVHYPDADSAIYESLIEGNTTVPGSDERYWKLV